MEYKFNIKPIELTDIRLYGNEKYNSNNHGNKPNNYEYILEQSHIDKWIDLFKPQYIKLSIYNQEHIKLIKLANKVGGIFVKVLRNIIYNV